MSQQDKPKTSDDDAEFDKMFQDMSIKLDKKADTVQETKRLAEECRGNPDLMAVRASRNDVESGRVHPTNSEYWKAGLVN